MGLESSAKAVAVLYSGGLDSSILLAHLLDQYRHVQPIYVDSGLFWQADELRASRRFLDALQSPRVAELVVLGLPLADLYADHWSITGRGVPDAATPDAAVYLPGRNPLLIIKAWIWCQMHAVERLALGCLKSNPFADATDEFFDRFAAVLDQAVPARVQLVRPFAPLDKCEVMQLGRALPLELTWSCLSPRGGMHCGGCNKCAERQQAFRMIEAPKAANCQPAARAVKIKN